MDLTMEAIVSKNLEKRVANVDSASYCRNAIATAAGPPAFNRKAWLSVAARTLDLSYRRCKAIWYGETTAIRADEYLRIRAKIEQLERSATERRETINEIAALAMAGEASRPARQQGAGQGEEGSAAKKPVATVRLGRS